MMINHKSVEFKVIFMFVAKWRLAVYLCTYILKVRKFRTFPFSFITDKLHKFESHSVIQFSQSGAICYGTYGRNYLIYDLVPLVFSLQIYIWNKMITRGHKNVTFVIYYEEHQVLMIVLKPLEIDMSIK